MKLIKVKRINLFLFSIIIHLTFCNTAFAQQTLNGDGWSVDISSSGKIISYKTIKGASEEVVQFRDDEYAGPAFEGINLQAETEPFVFSSKKGNLTYTIEYSDDRGVLAVVASIENTGEQTHVPKFERLLFGLNTYMEKFPDWNYKFFPTMLRSEKTHFTGYAMSPLGRVFAFASPDPLASWNYEYLNYEPLEGHPKAKRTGHRIYTVSFDLLHCLPLPERHPQHLTQLKAGQKLSFKLYLKELSGLDALTGFFAEVTNAPIIELEQYTVADYEKVHGSIHSTSKPQVMVFGPQNYATEVKVKQVKQGEFIFELEANRGVGNYKIVAMDAQGMVSEAIAHFRDEWSWYLNQARNVALEAKPTDTHHAECFYPLYTYFLARKHLPNKEVDDKAEEIFQEVFNVLFDPTVKEMRNGKFRIQDAATMIGILTDRYQVTRDISDMENAAGLVDFLMKKQRADGGYYSGEDVHYTSVIYIAKSIMEYLVSAKQLSETHPEWKAIYERHYQSAHRAIEDLANRGDDIQTEGQMTFEDGMISCSATQLAFAALREPDANKKEQFKKVSLALTDKHRCLTLLKIPDARMNGATLRFWESQYTVNLMHGGMNTPSGWSAWKTYGIWYQYLLTGDERFLKLTYNSLGSGIQLLDYETGKFRFSFSPDPYIEAEQFLETPIGSGIAKLQPVIVGEQYIDAMSYWHRYPHETWRQKWGIDNFYHEFIKCMEEISLTNVYVIEQEDGTFNGYGCKVIKDGKKLIVESQEQLADKLHVNLKSTYDIEFRAKSTEFYQNITGLKWVTAMPDDIKVY